MARRRVVLNGRVLAFAAGAHGGGDALALGEHFHGPRSKPDLNRFLGESGRDHQVFRPSPRLAKKKPKA